MKRVGPAPQTVFTLTLTQAQVDTATVESSKRVERDWDWDQGDHWPLAAGLYSALGSSSPLLQPGPGPGQGDHNLMSWLGILSWRLYTSGARDPHYPVHRVHPKSHITISQRNLSNGKNISAIFNHRPPNLPEPRLDSCIVGRLEPVEETGLFRNVIIVDSASTVAVPSALPPMIFSL